MKDLHPQAEGWDTHWTQQVQRMRRINRRKWQKRLSFLTAALCVAFIVWVVLAYIDAPS